MTESRIDNAVGRDSEDQFPFIDSGSQARFSQKPVISRVIEFENSFEDVRMVNQAGEHRNAAIGELSGNQAMGVALVNETGGGQHESRSQRPPRRASSSRRTPIIPGTPARVKNCNGGASPNIGFEFDRKGH